MIERQLEPHLIAVASRYPVVTLTGPRQSGKTTLCRSAFPDRPYVSLENPTQRELATRDPVGFLAQYPDGVILDEIQRAPELPSYLQGMVDEDSRPGRFILTGSQNFSLVQAVSQSLAGRTALLELLPLSLAEVRRFPAPAQDLNSILWVGGYPRLFAEQLPPEEWLATYVSTYVERDAREVLKIGDLITFQTFIRLCAGRAGQLLNLSSLAADCGISQPTARSWLSVLEASYIAFRLQPFHTNLSKRLIKAPKLYFYDSGLLCNLLGIEHPGQLVSHPLRGGIFESWVVAELMKQYLHQGRRPRFSFYRDRDRLEVDLLIERATELTAIEIKSSQTPPASALQGIENLAKTLDAAQAMQRVTERVVIYAGAETQRRTGGTLLSWSELDEWKAPAQGVSLAPDGESR